MIRDAISFALGAMVASACWIALQAAQNANVQASPKAAPLAPIEAATLLRCPVTTAGLQEWHRTCRARARLETVTKGR